MKKNRIIGLYGIGKGPPVSVREFTAPAVRVINLREGDAVIVAGFPDDSYVVLKENGDHLIPPLESLQLECQGSSRSLMCFIVET